LLLLLLLVWVYSLRKKLRREREPNGLSAAISSSAATRTSGPTPIASENLNSGGMSQQPSLPSTGPTPPAGPSPPELPNRNYSPWAPYVPSGVHQPYQQTYQQSQPGQPWQQTPGPALRLVQEQTGPPHTAAMPEAYDEGFLNGYRVMPVVQTNVYEANTNLPRPGISRMPDGTVYTDPVEIGQSNTPRVI
jgi:hypothetical protein